jgi:hypothetical protein
VRPLRLFLAKVSAPFDLIATEALLCPELVVGSAADTQIPSIVAAPEGLRFGVIELEKCSRFTAATVVGHVRAL